MANRRTVEKSCGQCGKVFAARIDDINRGNGRFCGRACAADSQRDKCKPAENFWLSVRKGTDDGCWEWQGRRDEDGYGRTDVRGRSHLAHRVAWALTKGDPGPLCVLHRCDNPPCCNPAHLFLGTHADNSADMVAKGRQRQGLLPRGEAHARAKLTLVGVREIRRLNAEIVSGREIARRLGLGATTIFNVLRGKTWRGAL